MPLVMSAFLIGLNAPCFADSNTPVSNVINGNNNNITINNNINNNCSENSNSEKILNVDSESSLCHAIKSASNSKNNIRKIVLTKDIFLSQPLTIESSLDIDLNFHKITIVDPNAQILIGKKTITRESYQVYYDGRFVPQVERVWVNGNLISKETNVYVPGHYETRYRNNASYEKDITVSISNGDINGCTPADAKNTEYAYWFINAFGHYGYTPKAVFNIISGKLFLSNVSVMCGNGSNGGNATYSAVWHIPIIGGGDGADGGDGGDGGSVFFSEEGFVTVDSMCNFVPGKPGKGGKGSKGNPDCWILKGSTGRDGRKGKNGLIINDDSKISFIN